MAVCRLANLVTLCDGHRVFFVAASGQIRMAADARTRVGSAVSLRGTCLMIGTPWKARIASTPFAQHGDARLERDRMPAVIDVGRRWPVVIRCLPRPAIPWESREEGTESGRAFRVVSSIAERTR
jgi:hypothetical protein